MIDKIFRILADIDNLKASNPEEFSSYKYLLKES